MLKTFDRYIIRKYVATFLFSVLICSMVAMAIDASEKLQNFLDENCTWKEILLEYYPGFMVHMMVMLMPIYTLVAVVFFTSRLANNNEILSMLNAGVSFRRLLVPYLLTALGVTALHFALGHFVAPSLNKARLGFEREYVWKDKERVLGSKVHFQLASDVKVFVGSFDKNNNIARDFRLQQMEGNTIKSIIDAKTARWQEDLGKWRLEAYETHTFDGQKETWTTNPSGKLDTLLDLFPTDFVYFQEENQEMTTPELLSVLERDTRRGIPNKNFEIENHRRTAEPFTNLILTIIGLAIAGRKVRGGFGVHAASALAVGAFYVVFSKFAVSFATNDALPVALGMWFPNIIFGLLALFLISRSQQ